MIEPITIIAGLALTAGSVASVCAIGWARANARERKALALLKLSRDLLKVRDGQLAARVAPIERRLQNLRNACFLTNERGHRVKYWSASFAKRMNAESGA